MASLDWVTWALLSAFFAALTAILAKIGLAGVDADLGTLLRAVVIALLIAAFVGFSGKLSNPFALPARTWMFLVLSGVAAAASWICYFRGLSLGPASKVATVDKLSLVLTALLAVPLLGERPTLRDWTGIGLVAVGVIVLTLKR